MIKEKWIKFKLGLERLKLSLKKIKCRFNGHQFFIENASHSGIFIYLKCSHCGEVEARPSDFLLKDQGRITEEICNNISQPSPFLERL